MNSTLSPQKMVDSGEPWLGMIPSHWELIDLKFLTQFVNGCAFKPDDWGDEGVPIIRIVNLNGGTEFNFTTRRVDPRYEVEEGDLLFGWSGNKGTSFGPFIWWRTGIHYLNQHIFRLAGFKLDKSCFYWLLKAVTAHVENQTSGIIGLVHVTKEDLGNIRVPVAPPEEQRAIAAFLDQKTAQIDAVVAKKQRLIERLQEKRQALISHAVTKGLDPHAPMKESGITSIGKIPRHWNISQPKRLSTKIVDGVHFTPTYVSEGVPFVTVKNLTAGAGISFDDLNYITEADHKELIRRANPERGDILITKDGTLGTVRVVETSQPFSIFVSVALVKPKHEAVDTWFLAYCLESHAVFQQFQARQLGSALKHIHLVELRNVFVPMPQLEEQKQIAKWLRSKCREIDTLVARISTHLAKLQEYRQTLISAAVTGKIDVTKEAG